MLNDLELVLLGGFFFGAWIYERSKKLLNEMSWARIIISG